MVYLVRIVVACICGAVVGYERQQRDKVAGFRTHILISMAAALMMIISKYGFADAIGIPGTSVDVSRVAASIITGIGILSSGIIIIGKRGNVSGLTTVAGVWTVIGIGMAIGAGMYFVGAVSVIIVEIVQMSLHHNLAVYNRAINVTATFVLPNEDDAYDEIVKDTESRKITIGSEKWERGRDGGAIVKMNLTFPAGCSRDDVIRMMNRYEEVISYELTVSG